MRESRNSQHLRERQPREMALGLLRGADSLSPGLPMVSQLDHRERTVRTRPGGVRSFRLRRSSCQARSHHRALLIMKKSFDVHSTPSTKLDLRKVLKATRRWTV